MDEAGTPLKQITLYLFIIATAVAALVFGMGELSDQALTHLVESDVAIRLYVETHLTEAILIFLLTYVFVATVSLPLESALSVIAGYYFGTILGFSLSIFSATLGATVMFIVVKNYLHDWLTFRINSKSVAGMTEGIRRNPFSYMLFLRIAPAIPHLLVNTTLALSKVKTRDYVLATFLGLMPSTIILVLAGTQLETIRRTGSVLSFETFAVLAFLALLSLAPVLWKRSRSEP